jgi:hypothetical protein
MFVRCVRATVTVLALVWAGSAGAQDAPFPDSSEFYSAPSDDDSYVADPNESFVVEHSGRVAAAAPRREPAPPPSRCREYTTDENDGYGGGLACPQPDGSWRIVSGQDDAIRSRAPNPVARGRAPTPEYPDYADEARDDPRDYEQDTRPTRRFSLDWNAWSSARRGPPPGRGRFK